MINEDLYHGLPAKCQHGIHGPGRQGAKSEGVFRRYKKGGASQFCHTIKRGLNMAIAGALIANQPISVVVREAQIEKPESGK